MQTDTARQADGRTTRWERHNATRRTRLVQDAVRAIRAHGMFRPSKAWYG